MNLFSHSAFEMKTCPRRPPPTPWDFQFAPQNQLAASLGEAEGGGEDGYPLRGAGVLSRAGLRGFSPQMYPFSNFSFLMQTIF